MPCLLGPSIDSQGSSALQDTPDVRCAEGLWLEKDLAPELHEFYWLLDNRGTRGLRVNALRGHGTKAHVIIRNRPGFRLMMYALQQNTVWKASTSYGGIVGCLDPCRMSSRGKMHRHRHNGSIVWSTTGRSVPSARASKCWSLLRNHFDITTTNNQMFTSRSMLHAHERHETVTATWFEESFPVAFSERSLARLRPCLPPHSGACAWLAGGLVSGVVAYTLHKSKVNGTAVVQVKDLGLQSLQTVLP